VLYIRVELEWNNKISHPEFTQAEVQLFKCVEGEGIEYRPDIIVCHN